MALWRLSISECLDSTNLSLYMRPHRQIMSGKWFSLCSNAFWITVKARSLSPSLSLLKQIPQIITAMGQKNGSSAKYSRIYHWVVRQQRKLSLELWLYEIKTTRLPFLRQTEWNLFDLSHSKLFVPLSEETYDLRFIYLVKAKAYR